MRKEIINALFNKTATEYDVLPVQHSNALQGAMADQLTKGPRTVKRLAVGSGLGLLAGLTAGLATNNNEPAHYMGMAGSGASLGLLGAGVYDVGTRLWEAADDVKQYRAAEAKQQLAREEAKRKREQEKAVSKTASAWTDTAGKWGWRLAAAPIGIPTNAVGSAIGAFEGTASDEEEAHTDANGAMALVPGVGAYRLARRKKKQMTDPETGSTKHYWSAQIGSMPVTGIGTSLIAPVILGAALMGGLKKAETSKERKNNIAGGAVAGALGGIAMNTIGAPIAAFINPRRTKEEQREATKSWLGNLLIPGVGAYNKWKAMGRAYGDSEERTMAPPESTVNVNFTNEPVALDEDRLKAIVAAAMKSKA